MKKCLITLALLVSLENSAVAEPAVMTELSVSKESLTMDAGSIRTQMPNVSETLHRNAGVPLVSIPDEQLRGAADTDGDGILDLSDNCIEVANVTQFDSNADSIGNHCDADIAPSPNDCQINFRDLEAMKVSFFSTPDSANWNADADLNGDNNIGFADLQIIRANFFGQPGPSGLHNACSLLDEGAVCDPGASLCGAGLTCCYPCGVAGCDNVCIVTCDPSDTGCVNGCIARP